MKTERKTSGAAERLSKAILESVGGGNWNKSQHDAVTALIDSEFGPLIEAAEWAEHELMRLGVVDNDKALGENKAFRQFKEALESTRNQPAAKSR